MFFLLFQIVPVHGFSVVFYLFDLSSKMSDFLLLNFPFVSINRCIQKLLFGLIYHQLFVRGLHLVIIMNQQDF